MVEKSTRPHARHMTHASIVSRNIAAAYRAGTLPPVGQRALAAFLQEYGMRAVAEIDLGRPRWREDPSSIVQTLRSYVQLADMRAQGQDVPLPPDEQFRRAARAYQLGLSLWRQHRTASLAFRVVACEALKPPGRKYDRWNVYDVVESLLGTKYAAPLRRLAFPPQKARSAHLHRGALFGAEGVQQMMMSTFRDPTFDEDYRVVAQATHAAMVEWLRAGGACPLPVRRSSVRKENVRKKRHRG